MKELVYETQGTCAKAIRILLNDDNVVEEVQFLGGCAGNTSGIASLVKGMKAEDVIKRLRESVADTRPPVARINLVRHFKI